MIICYKCNCMQVQSAQLRNILLQDGVEVLASWRTDVDSVAENNEREQH